MNYVNLLWYNVSFQVMLLTHFTSVWSVVDTTVQQFIHIVTNDLDQAHRGNREKNVYLLFQFQGLAHQHEHIKILKTRDCVSYCTVYYTVTMQK